MVLKKLMAVLIIFPVIFLTGCTEESIAPNIEPDKVIDTIPDTDPEIIIDEEEEPIDLCDIGYNETFDICVEPVLSELNFAAFDISIDDSYNISGRRMITNLTYNYFRETLDFDVSFESEEDIKGVRISVIDKIENKQVYSRNLYSDPSFSMNQIANDSFYGSLHLEGLVAGNEYRVIIDYTYATGNNTVNDRVLSGFSIDLTSLANRKAPILSSFEIIEATTDSLDIKFKILNNENELDTLEVRAYDTVTGMYTGVSHIISDLDLYKENNLIIIPSILLEGLTSNTLYNIHIYGTGSNDYDTFESILLFNEEELINQTTDKFYYDRESSHFFHFGVEGLIQKETGVLFSYDFVDERDTMSELASFQAPVYLRIKNANGYDILEVELDSLESGYLIPQNIYDNANLIEVYYTHSRSKQHKTLIIFGTQSMIVE